MQESPSGSFMLKDLNNTFISLFPKKKEVESFEDFKPISLCNNVYKVISKVIINRLKLALDSIISKE